MNFRFLKVFYLCTYKHGFWFRLFGKGYSVMLAKHHIPLFSERMGYTKSFYIFGLRINYLPVIKEITK